MLKQFLEIAFFFHALSAGVIVTPTPRLIGSISALIDEPPFTYSGPKGPENWADLDPEFAICRNGTQQSPIDINNNTLGTFVTVEKSVLDVNWPPIANATLKNEHELTLVLEVPDESVNAILYENTAFKMVNIHFHAGSEHFVQGFKYDMEMHLVHSSEEGELLVIGVLMELGIPMNDFFSQFAEPGLKAEAEASIEVESIEFDGLLQAVGGLIEMYHYSGSLTTPPCSEGVNWFVAKEVVEISISDFNEIKKHLAQPCSNRPIQRK